MRALHTTEPAKHEALMRMMGEEGLLRGEMLTQDPPEHTRIRRVLAPRFALRSIESFEGVVRDIVARCLDDLEAAQPPQDLVRLFAAPITLRSHCALLGVPERDIPMLELIGQANENPELSADATIAIMVEFRDYLKEILARKRAEPGDDLITDILEARVLDEEEILGLLVLLFIAGVDTTVSMLATGVFALLTHRNQLDLLRSDPSRINAAVEELMRYLTVFNVGAITRTAKEDVELGGEVIEAGEAVSVSLLGANRDGTRFANPSELDIERGGRGQIGFGHGVHVCLGQHLARLEMRVGLSGLLERWPDVSLATAVPEVPLSADYEVTYGVKRLLVSLRGPGESADSNPPAGGPHAQRSSW
jgi:cytochrome P450